MYYYTRLSLGLDSISLKFLENMKTVCSRMKKNVVLDDNSVEGKTCGNREIKSLEIIF